MVAGLAELDDSSAPLPVARKTRTDQCSRNAKIYPTVPNHARRSPMRRQGIDLRLVLFLSLFQ
jgi:hypothetical protein